MELGIRNSKLIALTRHHARNDNIDIALTLCYTKYVVTLWTDYEYGKYEICKSFANKDVAANFAWDLFCKNNPNFAYKF